MTELTSVKPPEMSVILPTPDRYATIRKTVRSLLAQPERGRLEVVIVAPSAATLGLDVEELTEFAGVRVVEIGPMKSKARATAAGIRNASAPIVVLAEDHCFPRHGWAQALLRAHEGPWAAVGPVVRNAIQKGTINNADILISYGEWLDSARGGIIEHIPGHNSSYKRDVLLSYGAELEEMLEAESILHWDLRARGHQLYLEPGAEISHTCFGRLAPWIAAQFHGGRMFAGVRVRSWPFSQRVRYAAAAPVIPIIRFHRILQRTRHTNNNALTWDVLATLFFGLCISALGEMVGYAAGKGAAAEKMCAYEFHRDRHLAATT